MLLAFLALDSVMPDDTAQVTNSNKHIGSQMGVCGLENIESSFVAAKSVTLR